MVEGVLGIEQGIVPVDGCFDWHTVGNYQSRVGGEGRFEGTLLLLASFWARE